MLDVHQTVLHTTIEQQPHESLAETTARAMGISSQELDQQFRLRAGLWLWHPHSSPWVHLWCAARWDCGDRSRNLGGQSGSAGAMLGAVRLVGGPKAGCTPS